MTIPTLNHRSFEREISGSPGAGDGRLENIIFFSDATLERVAKGEQEFSPESRRHALSELLVRYVLAPRKYIDSGIGRVLSNWLGQEILSELHDLCITCASGVSDADCDSVIGELEGISKEDKIAIANAVKPYLKADGIIPVIQGAQSWLLPFYFSPRNGEPKVTDARKNRLSEWSGYLAELDEITEDVIVCFRADGGIQATGDSLMLPIMMAWWRKHDKDMPQYRPMRFFSTGSLHAGLLGEVDVKEKGEKIALDIDGGFLVKPGVGGSAGEIAVKSDLGEIKALIRKWAEEVTICDASYAVRHLEDFDKLVRQTNYTDWESVNRRLDNISERLRQRVSPDAWLDFMMLKCAARCHAGRTEDALELNRQAREFAASKLRFSDRLLRLEIESLVILLDFEDFDLLMADAKGLEERLEAFVQDHPDSDIGLDLKMRYFGTMGQVFAYAGLRNDREANKSRARECFQNAFDCAEKLRGRCPESEGCRRLSDQAQDANYRYLWSELYDPTEADSLRQEAEEFAEALIDKAYGASGMRSSAKNKYFRQRIAALGAYRRMLENGEIASMPDSEEAAHRADGWIKGTTAKYMGAMCAARNDRAKAEKYFQMADEAMSAGRSVNDGQVLKVIHMTILAEAYRSLRNLDEDLGENYRRKAMVMFDDPGACNWKKTEWRSWLVSKGSDKEFPGLKFWY